MLLPINVLMVGKATSNDLIYILFQCIIFTTLFNSTHDITLESAGSVTIFTAKQNRLAWGDTEKFGSGVAYWG